jgi:hypothetical protein
MKGLVMTQQSMERIVHLGLENLMRHARILWPRDDHQILERNLSFYVGAALLEQGFTIVQEWPCGGDEHLDMVALHPQESTLLVLEAKRLWAIHRDGDVEKVMDDARRIDERVKSLECWSYATKKPARLEWAHAFGVVLASVSGANAEEAKANRARFEVTLNKKTGAKFCAVEHEDGTYLAVYRVWPIK